MRIFKISIITGLVLFLIIHTSFTLLYVLPENISPPMLKEKSKKYMVPLFDQSWSLFVPVPLVNKKVYVSYLQNDKQWSGWEDPFASYLNKHQSNRLSANAKIVFSLSNTLHYLYNQNFELLKEKKNIVGNSSSGYFKVLINAIRNELMWQYKENRKIKVLIVYTKADCNMDQLYSIYYPGFETSN